jgi:hypothetical protein
VSAARAGAARTGPARAGGAARPRPAEPRLRPHRPAAARRRQAAPRAKLRLRPIVIPLIALLLGGIVWINVARLQLTTETSKVIERSRAVQQEVVLNNAKLAQSNARVQDEARRRYGMVPADTGSEYLALGPQP